MKIALNLATLRGFGSSNLGRNVLRELTSNDQHSYLAWLPSSWSLNPSEIGPRCTAVPTRAGGVTKLLVENTTLRFGLARWRADRLFSLGDTSLPLVFLPHLLLVQQAFLAYEPCDWGFLPPRGFRTKLKIMEHYFRLGLPTVNRFTVQTEDMKRRLCARWSIETDRVVVVPSAIPAPCPQPKAQRADPPYICYVAAPGAHKNHVVFPTMMAELSRSHPDLSCKLTITAKDLPEMTEAAKRLGVLDRFQFLGPLPRERAEEVIRGAEVSVLPALLESFGMTYYEALALGCPVVAAERDFAQEACGDAALYASPHDGNDFGQQVRRILESPELRESLKTRGEDQLRKAHLTWHQVAERYLRILQEL